MESFASNDEFYAFVDGVSKRLADAGYQIHAQKLHRLLHQIAWTTSTELFGELEQAFVEVRATAQLSPELDLDLAHCLMAVRKALRR